MADTHGRKIVTDLLDDIDERVYPVGRLDKDSEGLLLMTNRGDLINEMMRAAHYHEKEYVVGANIAGFLKVAKAMKAQGTV